MRSRIEALLRNSILKDVAKLSFGTLAGRFIALATMPLITRLYSPEDFALLAVYLALVSTIAVVACARLEIAIPIAGSDADATNLLVLAMLFASCIVASLCLVLFFLPQSIASALNKPEIVPFFWLVPVGVMLAATYSAFQNWATRARRFGIIARTRISQAVFGVGTMVGFGWFGIAPLGLLVGNMLNIGAGGIRLAFDASQKDRSRLKGVSIPTMRDTLRQYRRYPIYSMPEALANVAGFQVPIILIAAFSGGEAGQLYLAITVMAMPMALLGQSVAQVYASRAASELLAGTLGSFTRRMMVRLALVGVPPLALAGFLSPWFFADLFGEQWARAGEIVAWIAPWMALQFIASPVSMALYLTGRQATAFSLQLFGLAIKVGSVLVVAGQYGSESVAAFSISNAVFYATYIATIYAGTRER